MVRRSHFATNRLAFRDCCGRLLLHQIKMKILYPRLSPALLLQLRRGMVVVQACRCESAQAVPGLGCTLCWLWHEGTLRCGVCRLFLVNGHWKLKWCSVKFNFWQQNRFYLPTMTRHRPVISCFLTSDWRATLFKRVRCSPPFVQCQCPQLHALFGEG